MIINSNERIDLGNGYVKRLRFYNSGELRLEEYHKDDLEHRTGDLPYCTMFYKNGDIRSVEYSINGNLHRDGYKPAYILYNKEGEIILQHYYINGDEYSEEEISIFKRIAIIKKISNEYN